MLSLDAQVPHDQPIVAQAMIESWVRSALTAGWAAHAA